MAVPLIIAGVAMAAGALMQYYNSEKARGATAERLKTIEKLFDKVKPPEIDLKVYDDPKLASKIPSADFDFSKITPEEYKLVAKISPESAPYVAEQAPQVVKASAAAKEGRSAQLEALQRYRSIAEGGEDPEFQQMMLQASRKARGDAQSRQASILDSFARRGVSGPGAELAMQAQGSSDAMQTEAITGQAAAADAYRNRLEALARGASLGGDVRQSEMSEAKTNADIINDFNQRSSSRYQDYLNTRANSIYDARVKQETMRQNLDNSNVEARNDANVANVERANKLAQAGVDNELNSRNYFRGLARDKAQATQQKYGNEFDIAKAKAGIESSGIDYMREDAQDRNNQIQQGTDSIATLSGAYASAQDKPEKPTPKYQGEPYDEGTTGGKYRRARADTWRTA